MLAGLGCSVKDAHCLMKKVLQTVSLTHPRNVLEMGGLPRGISKDGDIPQGEGDSVSSYKYELSEQIPMGITMKEKQGGNETIGARAQTSRQETEREDP